MIRRLGISAALLGLAACLGPPHHTVAPFDPANCYTREFSVYFESQSTEITPAARDVMEAMSETLRGCTIQRVVIVGEADARGSEVTSEDLSERRAEALGDFISQRLAWPRSRTELLARGEHGATTPEGLNVPVRNRAQITVEAVAPQ
ncbi:MAG: OmpA family protein [Hyphomonadaceae bacterium]|nr:OmpA family protein [Hyphomonadaceae bacterium]